MKSMTGFAKVEQLLGNRKISIEIKTLNSKTLDVNFKTSNSLRQYEIELRRQVNQLQRGKVDVYITETGTDEKTVVLNSVLIAAQYKAAKQLQQELGCDDSDLLSPLLRQPEAWTNNETTDDPTFADAIGHLMQQAIDEVDKTRAEEGAVLEKDINIHVDSIESRLKAIEPYEKDRITLARERIKKYFEEFAIKEIDPNRFEQEIIYYLEKLDITEEKVRLQKHIDYFRKTAKEEVACGKKLGFIVQEMGREINTTGSKSNHVEMQKLVVEMKDELEKIKEQLSNVL